MCTNKRWVTNKYTGHSLFVKCGHCPACQQEKAMRRRAKLKNSLKDGYTILFVTLTYKNEYVPHFKKSDIIKGVHPLPVYRSQECKYTKNSFKGSEVSLKVYEKETILFHFNAFPFFDYVPNFDDDGNPLGTYHVEYHPEILKLRECENKQDAISVIYYKDVQNFIKNLRIYSQRRLHEEKPFYSFQCSEMGPNTLRSHFHLLLFVKKQHEAWFRKAVCRCWPYADYYRTFSNIIETLNAETYVSSYVNRGSEFPAIFAKKEIRPRCSFSKDMGRCCDAFTLPALLRAIDAKDLRYDKQVTIQGHKTICRVRIPDYALNRYFPKVKGFAFCSLDSSQYSDEDFVRQPFLFERFVDDELLAQKIGNHAVTYDWDDYNTTVRALERGKARFKRDYYRYFGEWCSDYDYSYYYCQVQFLRSMTTLKQWYEQMNNLEVVAQSYDNLDSVKIPSDLVSILYDLHYLDLKNYPNKFPMNVLQTEYYSDMYKCYEKRKAANNMAYSDIFHDC